MNMSATMTVYNRAKAWARSSGLTDEGRVNRALGILKAEGALERAVVKYGATTSECFCPDNQHSGNVCKHRIALMLYVRHQQILNDEFGLDLDEEFMPEESNADVLDEDGISEALEVWKSY